MQRKVHSGGSEQLGGISNEFSPSCIILEMQHLSITSSIAFNRVAATQPISWMPQTHSRLKLNEDGACDVRRGRVGIGAVARDGKGKLKAALLYSSTSGLSPHATEALAVLYGMRGKHPFGCSNHNEARRTNK